jgi:hypothetical protein
MARIEELGGVADFPDRPIRGYRISQPFSSKVDPGEILKEYRETRFPDRFYNMKIGIPWADLERRPDIMSVLSLCSEAVMPETSDGSGTCTMGVDTGRQLHVVVLRDDAQDRKRQHLVHLGAYHDFADLDAVMARFRVQQCVIDGLPETHETRKFAERHRGVVFMYYFNEHQRGAAAWKYSAQSRSRPRLSPKARASLVLQGRYMGHMRQLKPRQKTQVRKLKEAKGVRAAIAKAKVLAQA